MVCAPSEDSDQPGHPPSLIRVFAVRMKKAQVLSYPLSAQRRLRSAWASHSEDSDQTGRMPRLIWVFAGHTVILLVLSRVGSFGKFRQLKHPTAILVYMPIPSGSQSRHHWVHKLPIISCLVTNHMTTTLYSPFLHNLQTYIQPSIMEREKIRNC